MTAATHYPGHQVATPTEDGRAWCYACQRIVDDIREQEEDTHG